MPKNNFDEFIEKFLINFQEELDSHFPQSELNPIGDNE